MRPLKQPFLSRRYSTRTVLLTAVVGLGCLLPCVVQAQSFQHSLREQRALSQELKGLQEVGESALKHIDRLPQVLPMLVERLSDTDKEVRFVAVKTIHAAARKIDRVTYWRLEAPDWEKIEPHFRLALERVRALKIYSRTERQIELLLDRKYREFGGATAKKAPAKAERLPENGTADLIDAFCRLRPEQIVEMWLLTKSRFPEFDRDTQIALFEELMDIASPRYFEFALLLTDDFDDAIIEAALARRSSRREKLQEIGSVATADSTQEEADSSDSANAAEYMIHHHARPQSRAVREKLVSSLLTPPAENLRRHGTTDMESNGTAVTFGTSNPAEHSGDLSPDSSPGLSTELSLELLSLSNSEVMEGELANQVVSYFLANPETVRASDIYSFLAKHKGVVANRLMEQVLEHGISIIRDPSRATWERGETMAAISQLAPGHEGVLQCAKEILDRPSASSEELVRETLLSLPAHGPACRSITNELLALAQANDEVICQCAMESLEHVSGIEAGSIEQLIARIKDPAETLSVKNAIGRVLRSNGQAASSVLHQHITKELNKPAGQRSVVDLLQALETVGKRSKGLDLLCREIASDRSKPLEERIAALHAIAVCATQSSNTVAFLQSILHENDEYNEVKAAALQTLAVLAKTQAIPFLADKINSEDPLISCSARHAFHLAGESNKAVRLLLEHLPNATQPEIIEELLREIGEAGTESLYQVLDSSTASTMQKQMAYRVLVGMDKPDWDRLLVHLKDDEQGEEYENSLRTAWAFDLSIVPSLFQQIEEVTLDLSEDGQGTSTPMSEIQMTSPVAVRAWSLADDFTSGLGSDTDGEMTGPAMRRAIAFSAANAPVRDLIAEIEYSAPAYGTPIGGGSAESIAVPAPPPSIGVPPVADAGSNPGTGPTIGLPPQLPPSPSQAPAFREPPSVEVPLVLVPEPKALPAPGAFDNPALPTYGSPEENGNAIVIDTEELKAVEVFYGTNRQPIFISKFGARLKWAAFGIAVLGILVCLFRFAYQRLLVYSMASMAGLVGLTMLANESLDWAYWFPELSKTYSGNYSDEVKYGVCEVTIPKTHVPGQLESPSMFLKLEFRPDPTKHIVLKETKVLSQQEFFDRMHATLDEKGKNLLVFIHGYNVSFEDAARRTAQMAVDLKFQGAPVFYSWPSFSDWYRYPDDAENIQRSVGQIREFLENVARNSGATSINLVAHSMGNVGLTQALAELESETPLFNQVVLAAPDIDASVFQNQIAPKLTSKAKRVTIYTSQTDLALLASRYFNSGVRVGDSSYGVKVFPGIETIDATSIDSSLLGHSYYGSSVNVLQDIANLFSDLPTDERPYLEIVESVSPPYWSFSRVPRVADREPLGTR